MDTPASNPPTTPRPPPRSDAVATAATATPSASTPQSTAGTQLRQPFIATANALAAFYRIASSAEREARADGERAAYLAMLDWAVASASGPPSMAGDEDARCSGSFVSLADLTVFLNERLANLPALAGGPGAATTSAGVPRPYATPCDIDTGVLASGATVAAAGTGTVSGSGGGNGAVRGAVAAVCGGARVPEQGPVGNAVAAQNVLGPGRMAPGGGSVDSAGFMGNAGVDASSLESGMGELQVNPRKRPRVDLGDMFLDVWREEGMSQSVAQMSPSSFVTPSRSESRQDGSPVASRMETTGRSVLQTPLMGPVITSANQKDAEIAVATARKMTRKSARDSRLGRRREE